MLSADWENQTVYLLKKFFEVSLESLLKEGQDKGIADGKIAQYLEKDEEEIAAKKEEQLKYVLEIYVLLKDKDFFTERQRQVLSLLFGWSGNRYVGHKSISDIAKILGIAQSVAFNHHRLAIKKLKKHFGIITKKKKRRTI